MALSFVRTSSCRGTDGRCTGFGAVGEGEGTQRSIDAARWARKAGCNLRNDIDIVPSDGRLRRWKKEPTIDGRHGGTGIWIRSISSHLGSGSFETSTIALANERYCNHPLTHR